MDSLDEIVQAELAETQKIENVIQPRPMTIQLFKQQTDLDVAEMLQKAERMFDKEQVSSILIPIRGYENDARHPGIIGGAKRKYAQAIEQGLLGFLFKHEFYETAQMTYGMAYCKVKVKGDKLRYSNFNAGEYRKTVERSVAAFNRLLPKHKQMEIDENGKSI